MKVLALLLLAGVAHADGKPNPKVSEAAGEAFQKAQEAEAKKDYKEAIRQYKRAQEIAPHPNTLYNLAEAERADKQYDQARKDYEKYLELSPDAPDRNKVEKTIDDLVKMPGRIKITSEEIHALAFVDGVLVGPVPREMEVPNGQHEVDVVTPITFQRETCFVGAGGHRDCRVSGKARIDGNVIISGSTRLGGRSWTVGQGEDKQRFQIKGRFQARPGRYEIDVNKSRQCNPVFLTVPAGDDVLTYAYITYPDPPKDYHECIDVKLVQTRVVFP